MEFVAWVALALAGLDAFLLVLVFRELALIKTASPGRRAGLAVDTLLPAFELPALDGSTVSAEDARGNVMLFVSGECGACRALIDKLRVLPDHKLPPLLIGVTSRTSIDRGSAFLKTLTFLEPRRVFLDERRGLFNALQAPVTPWAYVVDRASRIRGSGVPADVEELTDLARVAD